MLGRICVLTVAAMGLCFAGSGCITAKGTKSFFASIANDAPDPTDRDDGSWEFVGKEGRGSMSREKDPDSWWGAWFMSPKARAIERNFGIDH